VTDAEYLLDPDYCLFCKSVLANRSNTKYKLKFCSSSCSAKYNNHRRIKKIKPIKPTRTLLPKVLTTCMECSVVFEHLEKYPRKYCSQQCANKNRYNPNSTKFKKSVYKGFKMDSGAELKFAILLDEHNINWIKNTTTSFPYTDEAGKRRKYYPDFYLTDHDWWVEIKGKAFYNHKRQQLQLEAVGNIELMFAGDINLPDKVAEHTRIELA
jgi:hypothetical protein